MKPHPKTEYLEFPYDPGRGGILPHSLGRLLLGDDNRVEIFMMPDGLHIIVPKNSIFVHEVDAMKHNLTGLGKLIDNDQKFPFPRAANIDNPRYGKDIDEKLETNIDDQ